MSSWIFKSTDEFYVGYFRDAPELVARTIVGTVVFACTLIVAALILIITSQRPFSNAQFNYGLQTSLEGYFVSYPVPHLRILHGIGPDGNQVHQNVLLVGSGKFGVGASVVNSDGNRNGHGPTRAKVSGYLIYGDGKTLMQVNSPEDIELEGEALEDDGHLQASIGSGTLTGEIVDPKCFFGVMKPGEGKPHRSCAIRCISGGIPPVLKTAQGDYYLVVGENFRMINEEILPIAGDQVKMQGEIFTWGDWKIFSIGGPELKKIVLEKKNYREILSLQERMTMCDNNK